MSASRREFEVSWARTRASLERAFAHLPAAPARGEEGGSVEGYRELLDHNELELALDDLEMLGEANPVGREFWELLLRAADEMRLCRHAARYRARLGR